MKESLVDLTSLSPMTLDAWVSVYDSLGLDEGSPFDTLPRYLRPQLAALLFFALRRTPDSEETFPRGKWASIQALEGLIDRLFLLPSIGTSHD